MKEIIKLIDEYKKADWEQAEMLYEKIKQKLGGLI